MSPRALPEAIRAYRIGDVDGRFPVWSVEGAMQVAGRWHRLGAEVIYASEHYSTALLEKLVYCNGVLPPNQHFVEVAIPAGVSYEVVTKDSVPDLVRPQLCVGPCVRQPLVPGASERDTVRPVRGRTRGAQHRHQR